MDMTPGPAAFSRPKPSLKPMFFAQFPTGPSALVANLPTTPLNFANRFPMTPFDADLNPFMKPGP